MLCSHPSAVALFTPVSKTAIAFGVMAVIILIFGARLRYGIPDLL